MKVVIAMRNKAMAAIAVLLLFAAVVVVVGTLVYIFVRACRILDRRINPPPDTNQVAGVDQYGNINMPMFQFAPITTPPPGYTTQQPMGQLRYVIERSTNLVDWEDIIEVSDWTNYVFTIQDDTNQPPDRAFYRGKLVYPEP